MSPELTLLGAPILRAVSVPIVTWYAHPSLTWRLRAAHHVSNRMVASLASAYPYRPDKLLVLGQGIDTDLFSPGPEPPEEPPLILCAGRVSPAKDHATLLHAAALLRSAWTGRFRLAVVGAPRHEDRPHAEDLLRLVSKLDLSGVTTFAGSVPPAQLLSWYRRCTMHVNLTPRGFGDKVALEAMSCGRVSLTANDGFRETLGRWGDTLLFRPGDADDLADKLRRVLAMTAAQRDQVGQDLRARVLAMHSLSGLGDRLVRALEIAIDGSRGRA
jgi:glycosyltransferase involved in cell wall biosynthesis